MFAITKLGEPEIAGLGPRVGILTWGKTGGKQGQYRPICLTDLQRLAENERHSVVLVKSPNQNRFRLLEAPFDCLLLCWRLQ